MGSDPLLRFVGIALAVPGAIISLAALITGIKVLWAIGPGLFGAGLALFILFGQSKS